MLEVTLDYFSTFNLPICPSLMPHLTVQILAPLLDMVYRSDEKEKAVPLISRIMYYVFPYLKNHR